MGRKLEVHVENVEVDGSGRKDRGSARRSIPARTGLRVYTPARTRTESLAMVVILRSSPCESWRTPICSAFASRRSGSLTGISIICRREPRRRVRNGMRVRATERLVESHGVQGGGAWSGQVRLAPPAAIAAALRAQQMSRWVVTIVRASPRDPAPSVWDRPTKSVYQLTLFTDNGASKAHFWIRWQAMRGRNSNRPSGSAAQSSRWPCG